MHRDASLAIRIGPPLIISLLSLALGSCAPRATLVPPTATATSTATSTLTPEPTATRTKTPEPTATRLPPCEPSGVAWVTRFPTSRSTDDLTPTFRDAVTRFIIALKTAKASVSIAETYRSPERAYLMSYAYAIARENLDPASVPGIRGVNICWVHNAANGKADLAASKQAAKDMATAFNIAFKPEVKSPHIERRAIDMSISWQGDLKIVDAKGKLVTVKSEPRNGNNPQLHQVGASYGVIKLVADPPHWYDGK